MDERRSSKAGEALPSEAPYVVIFFRRGHELKARVRNVASQEHWIVPDATGLRDLLHGPTIVAGSGAEDRPKTAS